MELLVRATGAKFEVIDIKHAQIKLRDYIKEHGFGREIIGPGGTVALIKEDGRITGYLSYSGQFEHTFF